MFRPFHTPVSLVGRRTCRLVLAVVELGCMVPTLHASAAATAGTLYIREYRVLGAKGLGREAVEEAVYPFLGPERGAEDVEGARAALEGAYRAAGFGAATVVVPEQRGEGGVIVLEVRAGRVEALRVKGARYFLPSAIKAGVPSLAEGSVVNFQAITPEIVGLNQWPHRRVTPALRAGEEPGTVDIDLQVEDSEPWEASVALNNRASANTTALRLNGSVSDQNLWQLGHAVGASVQLSPEDWNEVQVYSGYYLARIPGVDWLTLTLQGTKQESNISTLGAVGVAGRGEILGARFTFTLPGRESFYHTLSLGLDSKHYTQAVSLAGLATNTPLTYYPLSATYSASWVGTGRSTELNLGVTAALRGAGSNVGEFDANRFNADGKFIYVRGDLTHTQTFWWGSEVMAKVQGQLADSPLVSSEQFGGGGLGTVRGYLEAEALGDDALLGTIEWRSPSWLGWGQPPGSEWRIYAFGDGGWLRLHDALPEQESGFTLASIGLGSRLELLGHWNASIDAALPLTSLTDTVAHEVRVTFQVGSEF